MLAPRTYWIRFVAFSLLVLMIGVCGSALGQIVYFTDGFDRSDENPTPWIVQQGSFGVTNGVLQGISNPNTYGFAYFPTNWTDYSVEAQIQFSSDNALGAGIGGRVDATTGAHYAVWVYPENSPVVSHAVRLVKFVGWGDWSGVPMATAIVPSVGTNAHQLKLSFVGNTISIAFDGTNVINAVDNNFDGVPALTSGGISADMYTDSSASFMWSIDNVRVSARPLVTITPANASRPFGGTNPPVNVSVGGLLGTDSIQASATMAADTLTPAGNYPINAVVSDPNQVLTNYTVLTNQGTLTITPSSTGLLYRDDFVRVTDSAAATPWTLLQGSFGITNQMLQGTGPADAYSYAYIPSMWSNYWVSATVRFSSLNGWGGGIGGRLNPTNGAHYGVWVYPAASEGGGNLLKLIKFRGWTSWSGVGLAEIPISPIGTNSHVLSVSFQTNHISVFLDSVQRIDVSDDGFDDSPPLMTGGITADVFTDGQNPYILSFDNVVAQLARPVLTLASSNATRIYGATNPPFSAAVAGVTNGDNISVTAICNATTNSGAGSYPIAPVIIDPENKSIEYEVHLQNAVLTVLPAPLLVTANNATRAYGQANPAFSGLITGFVNGEDASALGGTLSLFTSAISNTPVGAYNIVPSGLASSNYSLSYSNGTLTITPVALNVTADPQTRLYGAVNPTLTGHVTGIQNGDLITAVYSTLADTNSPTGIYAITPSLLDPAGKLGNYTVTTNSAALAILPAPLQITANNASRAYGQTNPLFSASFVGFVNGQNSGVLSGALSLSTPATTNSPVGNYDIVASGLSSTNYTLSYSNGTLTVAPFALTVTADDQTRLYGAPNPLLTGHILGVQNGDQITTTYSTLAETNSPVGSYTITPALIDSDNKLNNYAITTNVGTLTILPAPLLISVNDAFRIYGDTNPVFSAVLSGFVNSEDATVLSGALSFSTLANANSPVGKYPISASGQISTNYSITYSNGMLHVTHAALTVTANNQSRLYGATNPAFTGILTGLKNEDPIAAVYYTLADTNTPTGHYDIAIQLVDPGSKLANYSVSTNLGTLDIVPAPLLAAVNNASRAYGHTNPVFSATLTGFVNGQDSSVLGGALHYVTSADTNSPIGTYEVSASGLSSTNYAISYTNGALTITPFALTITPDAKTRLYGAANPALTGQITGVQNGEQISANYSTVAVTNSPVGSYNIIAQLNDPGSKLTNYSVITNTGMLTILPAPLLISANDASRAYGSANPAFTVAYSGFVNGEDPTALSGVLAVSTSADSNSPVGTYAIVPSGFSSTNYSVSYSNGLLTIARSPLAINIDNQSRVYGALNPPLTGQLVGLKNGDAVTATFTTIANLNTPVGSYSITPQFSDPSSKLSNYLVNTNLGTLTITSASSALSIFGSAPNNQNNVTFTVAVSPVAPAIMQPQGNVLLFVNGALAGQSVALTNGMAALASTLPTGTNLIVAAYLGDGNFAPSISGIPQIITNAPVVVKQPSTLAIQKNADATVTVTFSGTPRAQYLVQAAGDLQHSGDWTTLSTSTAGDDGTWTYTEPMTNAPMRFYRASIP